MGRINADLYYDKSEINDLIIRLHAAKRLINNDEVMDTVNHAIEVLTDVANEMENGWGGI